MASEQRAMSVQPSELHTLLGVDRPADPAFLRRWLGMIHAAGRNIECDEVASRSLGLGDDFRAVVEAAMAPEVDALPLYRIAVILLYMTCAPASRDALPPHDRDFIERVVVVAWGAWVTGKSVHPHAGGTPDDVHTIGFVTAMLHAYRCHCMRNSNVQ